MRPIRVLIAILGLDQHETGALAAAQILRDAGIEVIYLGRFAVPDSIVAAALQDDVDVIGLSCHSWEYLYYVDELIDGLAAQHADIPVVLGGGVLTRQDRQALPRVAALFDAAATPAHIVETITALAQRRRQGAD